MRKPTVSVLIPCYNRAHDIANVIGALQKQTWMPDEIIVTDDASTDQSVAVLETQPVKLVRHSQNQGPAAARNSAFQASSGDILVFIDADAYADSHLIESLMMIYQTDPGEAIGGVGGRGIEACLDNLADRWRERHAQQSFGAQARPQVPYLNGLCASYRRSIFQEVGGFDTFFRINAGEDFDIGLRIRKKGYRLAYTPQAIVAHQHRDTPGSLKRVQHNWAYWSYLARHRNRVSNVPAMIGLYRKLLVWVISDALLAKDLSLVNLDWEIFKQKKSGIQKAIEAIKQQTHPTGPTLRQG